ncbi:MAG: putative histidine kinase, classic [Ramlibacter sp.]|nr:putative histidine kinase, classic [Ramlibacter sp.]
MTQGRWSLGAYLALASSALSVLLTVLLTLMADRSASRDLSASIGSNLAELASQTTSRLDRGMFERYREIQLMTARVARLKDWNAVRAELDAAQDSYRFYAWIGVADAGGVVRAASDGLLEGADVSQRPWFRNGTSGEHLGEVQEAAYLAQALRAADGATPRFYDVSFPLEGGPSSPVLGAHVSWDWAQDVRQAIFGSGRRAGLEPLIVSEAGVVLLGPASLEGKPLKLASLDLAAGGEPGYVTETWPDGGTYLVGYARSRGYLSSPGLGWRVLVRQETGVAFEPVRALQRDVLLGGIALAIFFSLLGWLVARAVTRPLLSLADTARQIERGEAAQVQPSNAYSEVRVLGAALDSLLGQVRRQNEELQQLNAGLEQRVERRTSELRAAFERVRAGEQRVQTIIESAQDPFVGMDLEGRITDWSTQAEVVFGWAREEAIGQLAADLLLPARFAGDLDVALAEYVRTGKSEILNRPIERVVVDRHGRELPVEVKIGLVDTGDQRFFTAFLHDISQRKEVERMKDEFVSTVSHELRTPLTAIYGSLDLLNAGLAGELPPEARQLLAISHQSTERLIRLINDMLDLEKIASGKLAYRMQQQPLLPLVEQSIRDTRGYSEALGVQFRLHAQAQPVVVADADRIVQVCVNLLSNAAKFSPTEGEVEVSLRVEDGKARVGVVDQGAGVPPEFQDRIFDRFSQADSSDRRSKGGTGLGLAICRSIVEAHGGRLAFTSEPGVRTEFFFELPLPPG